MACISRADPLNLYLSSERYDLPKVPCSLAGAKSQDLLHSWLEMSSAHSARRLLFLRTVARRSRRSRFSRPALPWDDNSCLKLEPASRSRTQLCGLWCFDMQTTPGAPGCDPPFHQQLFSVSVINAGKLLYITFSEKLQASDEQLWSYCIYLTRPQLLTQLVFNNYH